MKKIVLFCTMLLVTSWSFRVCAQANITDVRQPTAAFSGVTYKMSVDYTLPSGINRGKMEVVSKNPASLGQVRASKEITQNAATSVIDINPNYPEAAKLWDIRLIWEASLGDMDTLVYTTVTPLLVYAKPIITVTPTGVLLLPDAEEVDPEGGGFYPTNKAFTVNIANLPADLTGEDRPTVALSGLDEQYFSFNNPDLKPFVPIRSMTQDRFSNQGILIYSKLIQSGSFTTNFTIKIMGYSLYSEPVECSSPAPNLIGYTHETIDGSTTRYNIITPLSSTSVLDIATVDSTLANHIDILVDNAGNTSVINIAKGALLMSRHVSLVRDMPDSKWYFFSFPYEVRTSEIKILIDGESGATQSAILYDSQTPENTPNANTWMCEYNGVARALGFSNVAKNNYWTDITQPRIFYANTPFAVCIPANARLVVPSSSLVDFVHVKGENVNLQARPHPVSGRGIAGLDNDWNLMAQPYSQSISTKDISVPVIHRYNSQTDTYTIAMNNDLNGLVLDINPHEPFFVQAAGQVMYHFFDKVSAPTQQSPSRSVQWDTKPRVDLELTNGSKLVVVENPEASSSYVYGEDGLYMGTMTSGTQSIYSKTPLSDGATAAVSVLQQPSIASVPVYLTGKNNEITLGEYSNLENIDQVQLCNSSGTVLADLKQVSGYKTSATSVILKVITSPASLGEVTGDEGYQVSYQSEKAIISGAEGKAIVVCDLMGRILFQGIAPDNRLEVETPGRVIVK